MKFNILLLEDDKTLGSNLSECLESDQYNVSWFRSLTEVKNLPLGSYDLFLLDLNLPDGSSFDFYTDIKKKYLAPVIYITAQNESQIRLKLFKNKVNDFISKPFTYEELKLRIDNVLHNSRKTTTELFGYQFDNTNHSIKNLKTKSNYQLNQKEYELLHLLFFHHPKTIARDFILSELWTTEKNLNTRTIDNLILSLRKTLVNEEHLKIGSVWGKGYRAEFRN